MAVPCSPPKVLSDQPRLSSAALSTTLNLCSLSFRPEFTHQCIEKEVFQGHRPLSSVLTLEREKFGDNENNGGTILHQSHASHAEATYELDIQIQLAPSCRKCQVSISRVKCSAAPPSAKKVKIDPSEEPLTTDEILQCISKALPEISDEPCHDDFCNHPIGTVLMEYSSMCTETDNPQHFVIAIADGATASKYHAEVQHLAIWFIENADNVNLADDQSGFWKVLYLYRKHDSNQFSLAGFLTLFHFNAPFHKPTPGILARICQALVLPPYQGQGHGKKLFNCVYDIVHSKHEGIYEPGQEIVQVNVEDPAPGFIVLRNKVDFQFLMDHKDWWTSTGMNLPESDSSYFSPLSEKEALHISTMAKITPRQVQIVNELVKLKSLKGNPDPDRETQFRLMVKRRLNKEHREAMGSYPTKEEKKAFLGRLFEEECQNYSLVVGK